MSVTSAPGMGSSFIVDLPLAAAISRMMAGRTAGVAPTAPGSNSPLA